MRFNHNVIRTAPRNVKDDPIALSAYLNEYNKNLGKKLSTGECPGHYGQTTGQNSVCLVAWCGGRV